MRRGVEYEIIGYKNKKKYEYQGNCRFFLFSAVAGFRSTLPRRGNLSIAVARAFSPFIFPVRGTMSVTVT